MCPLPLKKWDKVLSHKPTAEVDFQSLSVLPRDWWSQTLAKNLADFGVYQLFLLWISFNKEVERHCLPESIIMERVWNKNGIGMLAAFWGARAFCYRAFCGCVPVLAVESSQGCETGWNCTFNFDVITSCGTVIRNSDSKPRRTAVHLLDLKLSSLN